MKRLSALMLAACSVVAGAAENPDDFAYAMPIVADGQEALYQVQLPPALYRGVARADLRDVRVFNARGEAVPHAIRPPLPSSTAKPEPVALPLFPLRGERGRGIEDLQVHVEKRSDGTVVNIRSSGKTAAPRAAVLGYLLDASHIQQPIQALHFEWKALREGFSGKVRIDGSDDLSRWNTLTRDASLLDLEFGGHRLEQKRVAFHPQRYRYLRLSWPAGQKDVELTAVRAEAVPGVVEPQRLWLALPAPLPGENPGDYEYDSGGFFSFDRLRIELPQLNTLAQVRLLMRNQPAEAWRPAGGALVYRLRREGSELTNPDIAVAGHGERYLMLRIDQKGGGIGSGTPVVHIGWRPQQLVFAARGEAPFRLAYGSHAVPAAAFPIASLIPGYNTDKELGVASAALGEQVTLAGAKRLSAPIDYRRWALWASLILGVAVLGWMAYRLSRQMPRNDSATAEPPHSPDAHA